MRLDPAAGIAMLAASLPEKASLALARRVMAVLVAAAVALAPVGAASAGHTPKTQAPVHTMHHDHGAMQTAQSAQPVAKHCDAKAARTCCCDDKGACAQTCLQKCFGQMAVIPSGSSVRIAVTHQFDTRPTERPPGWSPGPQPPPPRA